MELHGVQRTNFKEEVIKCSKCRPWVKQDEERNESNSQDGTVVGDFDHPGLNVEDKSLIGIER